MTGRVTDAITCACGYRGPAVVIAGRVVCPICRTPAAPARPPAAPSPVPLPAAVAQGGAAAAATIHRIPCPRGHVLKARDHMLDQQVVCPECNEMFVLRKEDSLEERKRREKARRAEEERMAKLWLTRAIWAAAFIVASLIGMIVVSFALRAPLPPPPPAEQPTDPDPEARTE